jgi:hypothetical protein
MWYLYMGIALQSYVHTPQREGRYYEEVIDRKRSNNLTSTNCLIFGFLLPEALVPSLANTLA